MGKGPDKKPRPLRGQHVVGDPSTIACSRRAAALITGLDDSTIDRAIRDGRIVRRRYGKGRNARELIPYDQLLALIDALPIMGPAEEIDQ